MEDSEQSSAYTVTQAMNAAKRGLEKIRLTVIGEVSEFNDKSGYKAAYFTVHDDDCSMPCLMWRDRYNASGVTLQAGMLVELTGNFSCYPAKGRLQFSVASMQLAGEGKLRMQVAQLARKLEAEGLMDASRKRRVPPLPQRIAVVTSPRGKAVHDVIRTRGAAIHSESCSSAACPVEGRMPLRASFRVLRQPARPHLRPMSSCSCVVVAPTRISCPSTTSPSRAPSRRLPFPSLRVSGMSPDNSICDMVSDRRCSTPTAAAEAIALSTEELSNKLGKRPGCPASLRRELHASATSAA